MGTIRHYVNKKTQSEMFVSSKNVLIVGFKTYWAQSFTLKSTVSK